ncbi:MAG: nucleoside transporter [Candidatus Omnitrophica bacterium]|nr:nucleoside transporter [Candidatus Omnitrophota bacterium]
MDIYNFISFTGIAVIIFIAWLCSENKKVLNRKAVVWGVLLQLLLAVFIFQVPIGAKIFLVLNNIVIKILNSASAGSKFLFGRLALAPGEVGENGETSLGFILAFQVFPAIIFFSAFISALYYLRIMPFIIRCFSKIFTRLMRISGAESLVAASNIFVGIESILCVKPYLEKMTRSEMCTILTAGMATVASNVLVLYVFCLKNQFPAIAGHLISASLLSAPAAIVISKIILPEQERPLTLGTDIMPHYEREDNVFVAIINGANAGVRMIVGIAALLIAVLGIVALIDLFLAGTSGWLNCSFGLNMHWSLKGIMGLIFYPLTLIIGVAPVDAGIIASIIGERMVLTEVVAYQDLAQALSRQLILQPRSAVVATYALCGFAHLASMAIFVGGMSALAPSKIRVIAEVAPRALLAANLACLLTACIAGTFFTNSSVLLGIGF